MTASCHCWEMIRSEFIITKGRPGSGCVCKPIPDTMYWNWTGAATGGAMTGARSFGPDGPRQTVIRSSYPGSFPVLLTLSPDQRPGRLGHGTIKSLRLILTSLSLFTPSKRKRESQSRSRSLKRTLDTRACEEREKKGLYSHFERPKRAQPAAVSQLRSIGQFAAPHVIVRRSSRRVDRKRANTLCKDISPFSLPLDRADYAWEGMCGPRVPSFPSLISGRLTWLLFLTSMFLYVFTSDG